MTKRSITILMADDDPEDRMLARDALNESHLVNDLRFATDGEDLLDYLKQKGKYAEPGSAPRPGLILLDLNMPRKDGREALKDIKADPALRQIPIIVLTTSKAEEDIYRTYDLGVSSFITKPVSFSGLVEVMKAVGKYWFDVVELPREGSEKPTVNGNVSILLVDDDGDDFIITRDLVAEIPGAAYKLVWERTFEAGLAAWHRGGFELVLLDYRLGAHNGIEFLRTIREGGSQIPVIILTGQGDRDVDVAAMTAGATDFLIKSELTASLLDRAMRYALSITEMNQRLLEEHRRLLHLEKLSSVGLLAAGVAHEVNNPLAGVKSLFATLRDDPTLSAEKRKEYFDAIADGLDRMGGTIRGLLDLAREQPLAITDVDVADIATACLRLMAASLRSKGLTTDLQIASGERARGDRSKLMQAVLNLLMNATDATPRGGSIAIASQRRGEKIGIIVRDTGPGIPKAIADRVLEPFFTTKPSGQGTGLGLAIVNSIAKEHGGSLSIESDPGKGTTVTLWLNLA